jgi:4-amino-4-deoxychorismate lyase
VILVNGSETAVVSALDRGLAYGDGVFRTLAIREGAPLQWRRQYAKLAADCEAIGIAPPVEPLLRGEVTHVAQAEQHCALKVIVTRGRSERGYRYDVKAPAVRIVLSSPYPQYPPSYSDRGVRVRRCRLRLADQPALAGIKHLNRLENVLARAEWTDSGIAEGLLLDNSDFVIGGTMSNLFIVRSGTLITPDLGRCGVAGVTRDRVMHAATARGVSIAIGRIGWRDVLSADEAFLVNSLAGAWPISELEGTKLSTGPLVRSVQRWLDQDDDADLA